MNKSTPLSQLPTANAPPRFVNDQQMQYIAQAQQAISNNHMPQNTQASSDIVNDDDMVVQDILNQINASTATDASMTMPNTEQPEPQQNRQTDINPLLIQQLAAAAGPSSGSFQQPQFMHNPSQQIPPQFMYQMQGGMQGGGGNGYQFQPDFSQPQGSPLDYKTFMIYFADDLKLAALVFVVTVIIHFIPVEKFIGKYIAVDRIPYHQVLFRAIMAAIIVVILKKLAKI